MPLSMNPQHARASPKRIERAQEMAIGQRSSGYGKP